MFKNLSLLALGIAGIASVQAGQSCPKLYKQNEFNLSFNPAFLHIDNYNNGEGLAISSFRNRDDRLEGGLFQRDLVAVIPKINKVIRREFNEEYDLDIVSDLDATGVMGDTIWPNSVTRAPDGLVPFEALIVPQGFLRAVLPGRLTLINLDDPNKQEYLVDQTDLSAPAFYHNVVIHDMDEDGNDDIISVRSYFSPVLRSFNTNGELVWFKNPGDSLDPNVAWEENVLFGLEGTYDNAQGPDIHLSAYDFENDGRPEFVATHFFSGDPGFPQPRKGKISIYGAPVGKKWSAIDSVSPIRVADISDDQGYPFDLQMVDLNKDGRIDILASNHQPDACRPFPTTPGRVYALEMPASNDIFNDVWPVHILKDNIRPQPSPAGTGGLGRLAPGKATAFYPKLKNKAKANKKPSIVVGGDEAGKVWVLNPESHKDQNNWNYSSHVIFDINEEYGENTTQTVTPAGITVSTMGAVAVGYRKGKANLYIPVFEGKDIFVYSYKKNGDFEPVQCTEETTLACPVAPPGVPPFAQ